MTTTNGTPIAAEMVQELTPGWQSIQFCTCATEARDPAQVPADELYVSACAHRARLLCSVARRRPNLHRAISGR